MDEMSELALYAPFKRADGVDVFYLTPHLKSAAAPELQPFSHGGQGTDTPYLFQRLCRNF